jgi:hypothetical protein
VVLQEGWYLERTDHHGVTTVVETAVLTTANPLGFFVAPDAVTRVALGFSADGEAVGMGSYEIGIEVDEADGGSTDPNVPEGYCTSDAHCAAGETCCMAGFLGTCEVLADGEECALPDLIVSEDSARSSMNIRHEVFDADSCALFEGCVDAPGDRRLLSFDTETPNIGDADMILGEPNEDLGFEYSSCHGHYHFNGYANYQLLDLGGNVVRTGHKQAFCLLDSSQQDPTRPGNNYHCGFQGISAGWSDVYGSYLDCQWVDITGVDAGDYVLAITINSDRTLPEANYDNNTVTIQVNIPEDGVTPPTGNPLDPCTGTEGSGVTRECGWTVVEQGVSCTPGEVLSAACGCGGGTCEGDTLLRVCEGAEACTFSEALVSDDDGNNSCQSLCSNATFTCPASGVVTTMSAAFSAGSSAVCAAVISPVSPE